ncbi:MAG TPA: FKBP-type peptidyl-prolyl cis-trans isomerase [Candidatus Rubneribacter avistercoris]|nr:FKBP-type peptidyl-prolyl cis-trans isomerase [Candidatus Rubneribacter avistercoris]
MSNEGRMATVTFRGFFDDGTVFIDQTAQPVEFPCIDGWMPPAFVNAVRGMVPGETRTVRVGADEAYEERTPDRLLSIPLEDVPQQVRLAVGEIATLERPDGSAYPARLVEVGETQAVFDLNHDAVCKALNFEIALLSVRDLPDRMRFETPFGTCGELEQDRSEDGNAHPLG